MHMSKTTRLVIVGAAILTLIAIVMIVLMVTGTSNFTRLWDDYQLEKKLKDPANAQYVSSIRTDRAEVKRLDDIKTNTLGKIGSFGANAPEDIFFQKELQRLEQNREKIQTRLDETIKELK